MILSTVDNKTYINFSVIRCAVISFENGVIYFISWWGPASYVISSQVKGKLHWLHWQYVFEYMYWYFVDKCIKIRENNSGNPENCNENILHRNLLHTLLHLITLVLISMLYIFLIFSLYQVVLMLGITMIDINNMRDFSIADN